MKGWIAMLITASLLLGLGGCRAPVDAPASAPETAPSQPAVEETVPETQPETTAPRASLPEPEDADFVRVRDYLPEVLQQLPYATADNFTGHQIYDFTEVFLRYGTVKKLQLVCEELAQQGLNLKIWDGFRPVSAQFKLWEVCPDDTYVADPNKGFSGHSRGNTVDVTLVDTDGNEIEMPTGFDDFTAKADRDYSDVPALPAEHAMLLQNTMEKYGFTGYFGEWWHFRDNQEYPVEKVFEPVAAAVYRAECQEFINLRREPNVDAQSIARIPRDGEFAVLALHGDFALAEYQGMQGYVNRSYIRLAEK
ncbi:MAG: M15 family metallopeptidase [Firmicutes bacterium]|nr:M15 family metallopeptidase [Bacillota bacterium]